ncbi:hypothetical protein DKG34_39110 [Streptomyces sp. NWU49]|nr:hypothetical protein DKG34_39110 [Streptomyces sp. NWU49]
MGPGSTRICAYPEPRNSPFSYQAGEISDPSDGHFILECRNLWPFFQLSDHSEQALSDFRVFTVQGPDGYEGAPLI